MPLFLNPFDTTAPVGTDPANAIDGYILDGTKKSLNERYSLEHQNLSSASGDTTDIDAQGRHKPGFVGVLFYGTYTQILALVNMGDGSIAYATDTNNFYHYIWGTGWQILALTADTILPDNETLEVLAGGSGNVLGMKHDNQQWVTSFDLTDAANISTDCDESNTFDILLGGNRTLDNPSNLKDGASYIWRVSQDGAGSRTLLYGSAFKFSGGVAPVLTADVGALDMIVASCSGTDLFCSVMYDIK